MKLQITPEKLNSRWRKLFPNQIPDPISIADPLEGNEIDLEGSKLVVVRVGHTDTDDTSVFTFHRSGWSSRAMPSITAFTNCSTSRIAKRGWIGLPRLTKSTL